MSACATKPAHPYFIQPPAALLADCQETPVVLRINGDLVKALRARNADLKACNQDKADLRQWVSDMLKGSP